MTRWSAGAVGAAVLALLVAGTWTPLLWNAREHPGPYGNPVPEGWPPPAYSDWSRVEWDWAWAPSGGLTLGSVKWWESRREVHWPLLAGQQVVALLLVGALATWAVRRERRRRAGAAA